MDEIGIGILGCGTIGPLHAEAATRLRGARLVAVADQREERAHALAKRYNVVARADLEGLLSVSGVDVVSVCTPSGTHAALGCQIAESGRHVVLEKPIDVSLEAADEVITACSSNGVLLSVIAQHRFDAGFVELHEAMHSGRLGRITLAEARAWWYRTQAYYDADPWRGTWALDGGVLTNQGVHLVDLLLWLLGPVVSVFARASTVAHDMEAEDVIVVNLHFEKGALATLSVTTASYPGAPETLSVTSERASVTVKAGCLETWDIAGEHEAGMSKPDTKSPLRSAALGSAFLSADAHRAQLQDVADALQQARRPMVTGEDGRAALAVVHAAYESVRTGRDVPVTSGPVHKTR
jgi:predicted dehydrogenase